jgi:hypothetical protein
MTPNDALWSALEAVRRRAERATGRLREVDVSTYDALVIAAKVTAYLEAANDIADAMRNVEPTD